MTTTRMLLGLTAITFSLLAASDGFAQAPRSMKTDAKTFDVRVGGVSIEKGKVNAALLSGANQGILPGDKGFFMKDGKKVVGSEFEVHKVSDRVAWTATDFKTVDDMRFRTSLATRVSTPARTCTSRGRKLARVVTAAVESDTSISFTIDQGTDEGVMPSSATTPPAMDKVKGKIDITWVTARSAGGYVRDVANPQQAKDQFEEFFYEVISCKTK